MADDIQHKSLKEIVPKIHKRHFLEACLFGWIRSSKTYIPSITMEQSMQAFYKDMDITEEDYPAATMKSDYQRMTKEYYEEQKTKSAKE